MIDFERLDGPYGIPVYFQRMPAVVESVSLRWLMFTGSADDGTVGAPGIYHWFEHLPSRGTERYPGGYRDTEMRLAAEGGEADAHTTPTHTSYHAHVLRDRWREALDILTDMIARPLLREEDVLAERKIILEELQEWRSTAGDRAEYELPGILWPGHPLGHHPLGTAKTIRSMQAGRLREAFDRGYARSRAVLIVAGNLDRRALLDAVAGQAARLPALPLGERRAPVRYGPLPSWRAGERTERRTRFESSVVYALFPIIEQAAQAPYPWLLLSELCDAGGLGSPLQRLLRERRNLVYGARIDSEIYGEGGFWGFSAETGADNVEAVVQAFQELLRDPELRSSEWYDYVLRGIAAEPRMRGLDPDAFTAEAEDRLALLGRVLGDAEYFRRMTGVPHGEMLSLLDRLSRGSARVIVFAGRP